MRGDAGRNRKREREEKSIDAAEKSVRYMIRLKMMKNTLEMRGSRAEQWETLKASIAKSFGC